MFGSRFAHSNMGVFGDAVPDANLQNVFELKYSLVRAIIAGEPERLSDKPIARPTAISKSTF